MKVTKVPNLLWSELKYGIYIGHTLNTVPKSITGKLLKRLSILLFGILDKICLCWWSYRYCSTSTRNSIRNSLKITTRNYNIDTTGAIFDYLK